MAIATQAPAPSIKRCVDATIQAADRLDYWIRRYVVDHPLRHHSTVFSSGQPGQRFLFAIAAFGCWQSAIASRPSTTLSPLHSPRISLRSSSSSKGRNRTDPQRLTIRENRGVPLTNTNKVMHQCICYKGVIGSITIR